MVAKWNLLIQKEYTSEYKLLKQITGDTCCFHILLMSLMCVEKTVMCMGNRAFPRFEGGPSSPLPTIKLLPASLSIR